MAGVYQDIIDSYRLTKTIKDTAEIVGVSKVKVQRVLLTEGLWSSKSSKLIGKYYSTGASTEQIAKRLNMSVKNVQAYIPYSKGEYRAFQTSNSVRCRRYRDRLMVKQKLQDNPNPETIWDAAVLYQGYPFVTKEGKKYKYTIEEDCLKFDQWKKIKKDTMIRMCQEAARNSGYEEKRALAIAEPYLFIIFIQWGIVTMPGLEG